jgi:hypothetical protein
MDPELLKIVLIVAALTAGLVLALVILRARGHRRAERLGAAFELGTSRSAGFLGSALEGLYRGYSCRYQVQYASQYDRGGARLRLAIGSPHRWSAEVLNPGNRMLARLGLISNLEIGDSELDERLRFAAAAEGDLLAVFGSGSVREAMRALASSDNFESARVRGDRIDVRWAPRAPQLDENAEVLRVRLELVTTLLAACAYPPSHARAT